MGRYYCTRTSHILTLASVSGLFIDKNSQRTATFCVERCVRRLHEKHFCSIAAGILSHAQLMSAGRHIYKKRPRDNAEITSVHNASRIDIDRVIEDASLISLVIDNNAHGAHCRIIIIAVG